MKGPFPWVGNIQTRAPERAKFSKLQRERQGIRVLSQSTLEFPCKMLQGCFCRNSAYWSLRSAVDPGSYIVKYPRIFSRRSKEHQRETSGSISRRTRSRISSYAKLGGLSRWLPWKREQKCHRYAGSEVVSCTQLTRLTSGQWFTRNVSEIVCMINTS